MQVDPMTIQDCQSSYLRSNCFLRKILGKQFLQLFLKVNNFCLYCLGSTFENTPSPHTSTSRDIIIFRMIFIVVTPRRLSQG